MRHHRNQFSSSNYQSSSINKSSANNFTASKHLYPGSKLPSNEREKESEGPIMTDYSKMNLTETE